MEIGVCARCRDRVWTERVPGTDGALDVENRQG